MQQRLVVWGDIGTDRKALIAIELEAENNKVVFRAYPDDRASTEIQNLLFTHWKNGGEITFPADLPTWESPADVENIVPEEIHLHKPDLLVSAQRQWNKKVLMESNHQLMSDRLHLLEQEIDMHGNFDQKLWDRTRQLWGEITRMKKEGEISWQHTDELKVRIDRLFDGMKALRRLHREKNFDESKNLSKLFEKQIEDAIAHLVYPKEWGKTAEKLKQIQRDMKDSPLVFKHVRHLRKQIDKGFKQLREFRQADRIRHLSDRVESLKGVITKLKDSAAEDLKSFDEQFEKMKHYTRGRMSDGEIFAQLMYLKERSDSKEKKIFDIEKTIKGLVSKIKKMETQESRQKDDKGSKGKDRGEQGTKERSSSKEESADRKAAVAETSGTETGDPSTVKNPEQATGEVASGDDVGESPAMQPENPDAPVGASVEAANSGHAANQEGEGTGVSVDQSALQTENTAASEASGETDTPEAEQPETVVEAKADQEEAPPQDGEDAPATDSQETAIETGSANTDKKEA